MDEPFTKGIGDEYEDYYDYNDNHSVTNMVSLPHKILAVVYSVIFLLGVSGNGVVIWILGFKMKKSINTTWYLSLAISDFIFCACVPFMIMTLVTTWPWLAHLVMCKFLNFVLFLNMFSSIFLLVLISVDRCVSVVFPAWSQKHRTTRVASALVLFAWAASAVLSVYIVVFICGNSSYATAQAIILSKFVCGFLIPFIVITICYTVIFLKLTRNQMTKPSKPFKVMSALIVTFCICWLPYHIVNLLAIYHHNINLEALITTGYQISRTLAFVNSVLNPILYVLMGTDFKQNFKNCIFSKIENAIDEEGSLSRLSSMNARASTHV